MVVTTLFYYVQGECYLFSQNLVLACKWKIDREVNFRENLIPCS